MIPLNLTDEQRAAIQADLDEARTAYHTIMNGTQARVVVDQNGERVEFNAANSAKLAQYIVSLELKLASCTREIVRAVGPATFTF